LVWPSSLSGYRVYVNGLGTKGCSLAPYFGQAMAEHIIYNIPILPEADIKGFQEFYQDRPHRF